MLYIVKKQTQQTFVVSYSCFFRWRLLRLLRPANAGNIAKLAQHPNYLGTTSLVYIFRRLGKHRFLNKIAYQFVFK